MKVSHAGSFSGEVADVAGEGVAVCSRRSTSGMSGGHPAKTNLDVAKGDNVTVPDGASFAVGNALAVDASAICRARVGDQQTAKVVHFQRRMNFGDARMIQVKIVVSGAPNIDAPAARFEFQRNFLVGSFGL